VRELMAVSPLERCRSLVLGTSLTPVGFHRFCKDSGIALRLATVREFPFAVFNGCH